MPATTSNTTVEYCDGFDDWVTIQAQRYGWGEVTTNVNTGGIIATAGPLTQFTVGSGNGRTGNGLHCDNGGGFSSTLTLGTQATRTMGIAIKLTTFPQANNQACILTLVDGGVAQLGLRCNFDGTLSVVKGPGQGNGGTVLGSPSTQNLVGATWYYIEFSSTIGSPGSYTVRVNNTQWFTGSGVTRQTANNFANVVAIGGFCGNNPWKIDVDDFYSRADGIFCGDCRVLSRLPSSNGPTIQLTRGGTGADTGFNWSQVKDPTADDDVTYNIAAATGLPLEDIYNYPNLPVTSGTVIAVMSCPIMRNDSAGVVSVAPVYNVSGVDQIGTAQNVGSTSYGAYPDIQGSIPGTGTPGTPWSVAAVNSTLFGIKRTL